jgi:hypothetical protein
MPLRTSVLNSGPFPRPALPGVLGRTGLSATPSGPVRPSRASSWRSRPPPLGASRVASDLRVQACHRQYPGGTTGSRRFAGCDPQFPSDGGLPRFHGGSAPTFSLSGPAQRSLALRPTCSRSRLKRPFTSKASAVSLPPPPLRLLPAGATRVAGRDLHPLKRPNQTAPVPQGFSRPSDRPIVSVPAWLALADWFRRYQRRQQGVHPCGATCDEGSPPIPHSRLAIRSGPECPTPLAHAASHPPGPTDPDLASPPAAAPPSPDREGGRP